MTPADTLPIRRLTLYKHGVGFVERGGQITGVEARLAFRREEVNDALKSLLVLDRQGGQVVGIDYDTPADRAARLAESGLDLSPDHSLLDLLRGLRGWRVRLEAGAGTTVEEVTGQLVGVEVAPESSARRAQVAVWDESARSVVTLLLGDVRRLSLLEDRTARDLQHFLDTSRSEEARRTVTVRLSPGEHDLAVSYLAPSPTWRVSYRLVADPADGTAPAGAKGGWGRATPPAGPEGRPVQASAGKLLLQGWGLFDNRLEEDLVDVAVTLVAGQPISFVYDLATSRIPARPVVQDEARIAAAPVEFEEALAEEGQRFGRRADGPTGAMRVMHAGAAAAPAPLAGRAEKMSADDLSRQAVAATGSELGELFQYRVVAPVTVRRGASALVPILGAMLPYRRELLFNAQKLPLHPVAALRFTNDTGLVLERGPVTVVEGGEYRGEALVPFTKEGAEVYVAFAVELGIKVQQASATRRDVVGLRIDRALLWMKQATTVTTTYTLSSGLATDAVVTVEHRRMPGFDLVDTRQPGARTPEWYRWDVPCPPHQEVTFAVAQRTLDWQQQQVADLSYDTLGQFLERRWLDRPTLDRLRSILTQRHTIARNTQESEELQTERDRLYQRQEQLRSNLTVLGASGEEAGLRRQVFGQLQTSEERLAQIDARQTELAAQNRALQAALEAALAALQVDEVGDQ